MCYETATTTRPVTFQNKKKTKNWELDFSHLFLSLLFLGGEGGWLEKTNKIPNEIFSFFLLLASEEEDDDDHQQQQHRGSVMWWHTGTIWYEGSTQVLNESNECEQLEKKKRNGWRRLWISKWVWPNWLHPGVVSRRVHSLCPSSRCQNCIHLILFFKRKQKNGNKNQINYNCKEISNLKKKKKERRKKIESVCGGGFSLSCLDGGTRSSNVLSHAKHTAHRSSRCVIISATGN